MKYTESEIRAASRESLNGSRLILSNVEEELIRRLKKNGHAHDFTENDTITVKELRQSWERVFPGMYPEDPGVVKALLEDISKHRDPGYKPGKVYRTATGIYLRYTADGNWQSFGSLHNQALGTFPESWLPLEEMS